MTRQWHYFVWAYQLPGTMFVYNLPTLNLVVFSLFNRASTRPIVAVYIVGVVVWAGDNEQLLRTAPKITASRRTCGITFLVDHTRTRILPVQTCPLLLNLQKHY